MPKQVNRIPGIKPLAKGGYQARVFHKGQEESQNFARLDDAQKWHRNLKKDLERCPVGIIRSKRAWVATLLSPTGVVSDTFADLDDAINWIDRGKVMISLGTWVDPHLEKMTFSEYAQTWRASKNSVSGKTLGTYNSQLRLHIIPHFGQSQLTAITTAQIRNWVSALAEKGTGPTTIRQSYRLLHQVLENALTEERITRNPCRGIKLPKIIPAERRGLTREELNALAYECGEHGSIILFLGTTGLRIGEALALRVEDINQDTKTVVVNRSWTKDATGRRILGTTTKTGNTRKIPLSPSILVSLRPFLEHKSPDGWLFVGPRAEVMDYDWLRKSVFIPAAKRLGLEGITLHSLRHTCASLLIKLGAPITTVSNILGHTSVKMTLDTYGHYYEDDTAEWINNLG